MTDVNNPKSTPNQRPLAAEAELKEESLQDIAGGLQSQPQLLGDGFLTCC